MSPYFTLRGGILTGSASTAQINPYGVAAASGLSGLFSKQAVDKLREVFDTLLKVGSGGDQQRADKVVAARPTLTAAVPARVVTGSGDTRVTLTGSGFPAGVRIEAELGDGSGVATLIPVEASPTQLVVVLPERVTAVAGTVRFSAVDPTRRNSRSDWISLELGE